MTCSCSNVHIADFDDFLKNANVCMLSSRLVRGEGEIIEEIVSREKNKEINKVQEKVSSYNFVKQTQSSLLS